MFYHRRRRRLYAIPTAFRLLPPMSGVCVGVALVAASPSLLPTAGLPLLLLPACLFLQGTMRAFFAGLLLGVSWATAGGSHVQERWLPSECERQPVVLRGYVASVPETATAFGEQPVQRFLLDVSALEPARCAGPARVRLSYYGNTDIAPGQYGEFAGRLRVPWGLANPGGADRESWYAVNGIQATGSVRRIALEDRGLPWRYRHHVVRAGLQRSMESLPGSARGKGVLVALTVGVRHGITHHDWSLFRELGVVHLAVISGLHVSLAAGAGAVVGRVLARGVSLARAGAQWRQLPGILALASALMYAALAGFSLPTVRALAMLAGVIVAFALGRDALKVHTLLFAALVLVLMQPLALVSSSFWLSLGAVCALLWFLAWQPRRQPLTAGLRVHGYLCLAMLPLTAWWFGGGSVIAPAANAVAVPVVGLLVVPLTLLASLADPLSSATAEYLWSAALALIELLLSLADTLLAEQESIMRYRALRGGTYAALNALVAAALLGMPLPFSLKAAVACLLLPLLLREAAPLPEPRPELVVLDVGQGTSVVVSDGRRALVYDTGGGEPGGYTTAAVALLPFLRHRGIDAVDTLVVSHADRDHSAGTQALIDAMPVGELLYGQTIPGTAGGVPCRTGTAWAWPSGIRFRILAGADGVGRSANDASCVLQVDLAGFGFLLPGDISAARERELVLYWREALRADWLLAAHHGSGSSTTAAWLRAVNPGGVVLNFGRANPFGHPHPEVIARLMARGIDIRTTAREGALVFRVSNEGELEVIPTRGGYAPFWKPPA
ncbi:DNA internalization-related competence protein ComEC/Rec2 [Chromatocurvus halotolerans]|nr:DNA internalization-related competence protein ComEC/Rec2 [Chromatocurvus halotolerans]